MIYSSINEKVIDFSVNFFFGQWPPHIYATGAANDACNRKPIAHRSGDNR